MLEEWALLKFGFPKGQMSGVISGRGLGRKAADGADVLTNQRHNAKVRSGDLRARSPRSLFRREDTGDTTIFSGSIRTINSLFEILPS